MLALNDGRHLSSDVVLLWKDQSMMNVHLPWGRRGQGIPPAATFPWGFLGGKKGPEPRAVS